MAARCVQGGRKVPGPGHVALGLHSDHRADLEKSGLTRESLARLRITSVRPHDIKQHVLPCVTSAYRIPYFAIDAQENGFERWKLFPPIQESGHTQKYYQLKGTDPHVYFPPLIDWKRIATDPSVSTVVTEGEKKAAKGCQEAKPSHTTT